MPATLTLEAERVQVKADRGTCITTVDLSRKQQMDAILALFRGLGDNDRALTLGDLVPLSAHTFEATKGIIQAVAKQ